MSHFQSLSVFLTVVAEGSFSSAAKKLQLTQPTVSFHIDNLEKDFGCSLFTRTAKGVQMTIYGQKLYANISNMNDLIYRTRQQLTTMLAGTAGQIMLGASSIPSDYILPRLISDFIKLYPELKIKIKTDDSQSILKAYAQGEIPLAIVGVLPSTEKYRGQIVPLMADEIVLAASPKVGAELSASMSVLNLKKHPFVIRKSTSGSHQTAMTALHQYGINSEEINIVLEVSGNQALKTAIRYELGIGFISKWAIQAELERGELVSIALPTGKINRQFYAICDLEQQPPCLETFWQFLLKSSASWSLK